MNSTIGSQHGLTLNPDHRAVNQARRGQASRANFTNIYLYISIYLYIYIYVHIHICICMLCQKAALEALRRSAAAGEGAQSKVRIYTYLSSWHSQPTRSSNPIRVCCIHRINPITPFLSHLPSCGSSRRKSSAPCSLHTRAGMVRRQGHPHLYIFSTLKLIIHCPVYQASPFMRIVALWPSEPCELHPRAGIVCRQGHPHPYIFIELDVYT